MLSARDIKRYFKRRRAWRETLPLLERDYRQIVEQTLNGPITWHQAGGRGRDVIALVKRSRLPVAFLRLATPLPPPTTTAPRPLPFVALDCVPKLEREWQAYAQGSTVGLTPKPLWRNHAAILSSYLEATPLSVTARCCGGSSLTATLAALPAIAKLHEVGITHLDMSLANILRHHQTAQLCFVDFEYGPAPELTLEHQILYDYLRLFESVWKFLTAKERTAAGALWLRALQQQTAVAVRQVSLDPLRPALSRILAAPELQSLWQNLSC